MAFMRKPLILAAVLALPATVAAAHPLGLARVAGGLWEISGVPGTRAPVRECVGNPMLLAQFEHRRRNCARTIVSNSAKSTVVSYSCGSGDFGRSKVDVLTPRALRIDTQGISDQLPFGYVLQAHRIGDCPK